MKKTILFSLSILIVLGPRGSTKNSFPSVEALAHWMTYYYLKPEPARLQDALESLDQLGFLDVKDKAAGFFGFMAGVLRDHPEEIVQCVKAMKDNEEHLGICILGMWYAKQPITQKWVKGFLEKHPRLKPEFKELLQGMPIRLEEIPLEQGPWVLDALWGEFMATGRAEPVVRIIQALKWIHIKGHIDLLVIAGAAQWSLTSNAIQHTRVFEICKDQIDEQPAPIADTLRMIIAKAEKERSKDPHQAHGPVVKTTIHMGFHGENPVDLI